jgi:hypothetical protein
MLYRKGQCFQRVVPVVPRAEIVRETETFFLVNLTDNCDLKPAEVQSGATKINKASLKQEG